MGGVQFRTGRVREFSKVFLKMLTEGAVTTEAGSLFKNV